MESSTSHDNHTPKKKSGSNAIYLVIAIIAVGLIIGGGFFVMNLQKSASASGQNAANSQQGFGGRGSRRSLPAGSAFGQVSSVSSTSITITNPRTNSSTTYTIDGNTTFSNNGASGSASDIQNGDRVIVQADPSNSSLAKSIRYGMMGGPGGNSGGQPQNTQSSTDNSSGGV